MKPDKQVRVKIEEKKKEEERWRLRAHTFTLGKIKPTARYLGQGAACDVIATGIHPKPSSIHVFRTRVQLKKQKNNKHHCKWLFKTISCNCNSFLQKCTKSSASRIRNFRKKPQQNWTFLFNFDNNHKQNSVASCTDCSELGKLLEVKTRTNLTNSIRKVKETAWYSYTKYSRSYHRTSECNWVKKTTTKKTMTGLEQKVLTNKEHWNTNCGKLWHYFSLISLPICDPIAHRHVFHIMTVRTDASTDKRF